MLSVVKQIGPKHSKACDCQNSIETAGHYSLWSPVTQLRAAAHQLWILANFVQLQNFGKKGSVHVADLIVGLDAVAIMVLIRTAAPAATSQHCSDRHAHAVIDASYFHSV